MSLRNSTLPPEEQRVGTSVTSFDELLARELAKEAQLDPPPPPPTTPQNNARRSVTCTKQPFLKRGDRGWWMDRPDIKAKVVKHVLTSKDVDSVESSTNTSHPPAIATAKRSTRPLPHRSSASNIVQRPPQPPRSPRSPPPVAQTFSDSVRTTTSVETLDLQHVRLSFEAQAARDAHELAAFEALEHALAAEKGAFEHERQAGLDALNKSDMSDDVKSRLRNQPLHPDDANVSELSALSLNDSIAWSDPTDDVITHDSATDPLGLSHFQQQPLPHVSQLLQQFFHNDDDDEDDEEDDDAMTHYDRRRVSFMDANSSNDPQAVGQTHDRNVPLRNTRTRNAHHPQQQQQQQRQQQQQQRTGSLAPRTAAASMTHTTHNNAPKTLFPVVIEEKLHELDAEVRFYKRATLALHQQQNELAQQQQTLANDRQAFTQWQLEQRDLMTHEWARERLKMKREEALVMRQLKLQRDAAAATRDRSAKSDVETLKAQIVAMQLDEKARATKAKATHETLRQRIQELEAKNRALSDEIRFLELERLDQWGKRDDTLSTKQRANGSIPSASRTNGTNGSNGPNGDKRPLQTLNDVVAITDTADALLRSWQSDRRDNDEEAVEPDRRDDDDNTSDEANVLAAASSTENSCNDKTIERDVVHPGGKREVLFTDGSRTIHFADGNEKTIDADGHTTIRFTNGDRKETTLTTYPDKTKVYEFPNDQIETSFPDGTTEIAFADGIHKTIRPTGDEYSIFPDGTTLLEQRDGVREVTLRNKTTIRYDPNGTIAFVTPNGVETPVESDAELQQLLIDGL